MYHGIRHDNIAVIGSGHTIEEYATQLRQYLLQNNYKVIGVNFMTSLCCPHYHLWTNRKQYDNLGQCINPKKSTLMFGHKMPNKLIKKHCPSDYIKVVYSDDNRYKGHMRLREKHIKGRFRTAGCLAISIAYLMEADNIVIAGMDGFTLHGKNALKRKIKNHHCYGLGYTDDASWKKCKEKDKLVYESLDELSQYVAFKIITPTKFNKHYKDILGIGKWSN